MSGITDCALVDIYGYIDKVKKANIILISYYFTSEPIMQLCICFLQHKEREFILKFSAMEIYNESVRDLLSTDTSPLRLLDDPEVNMILSFILQN